MVNKYEVRIPQINGIQLFILSLLLTAYTLMGLKTSQGGEIHYRQAVSERSKKNEKTNSPDAIIGKGGKADRSILKIMETPNHDYLL